MHTYWEDESDETVEKVVCGQGSLFNAVTGLCEGACNFSIAFVKKDVVGLKTGSKIFAHATPLGLSTGSCPYLLAARRILRKPHRRLVTIIQNPKVAWAVCIAFPFSRKISHEPLSRDFSVSFLFYGRSSVHFFVFEIVFNKRLPPTAHYQHSTG